MSYRACVGIALFNTAGKVFVGQRIDRMVEAWQMPQGGVDPGETAEQALWRELGEEVGLTTAEFVAALPGTYRYDLPEHLARSLWNGAYKGQEQQWFALLHRGADNAINIKTAHPEFQEWRWAELEELLNLIVPFKRDVYAQFLPALIAVRDQHVRGS